MAMRLPRALTTLTVTATLLGAGLATTTQAATAAGAPQAPASTSTVKAGSLSASLTASASAGALAGVVFSGRRTTVAPRVLPVLTTRPRAVPLTPAPKPPAPVVTPAQAYAKELVRLVNVQRAAHGLRAVKVDTCATTRALAQTSVLVRTASLSHQDLGRVLSACNARGAGENVAFGKVSAAAMMSMWMNSSGHRANILSRSFTHIGIGAYKTTTGRWYGTQVFLTR
jgi:uncharacterized protein YkwD